MASLLNKLVGGNKKLTQAEEDEIARKMYVGAVPFVDKAYKSDPRTALANTLGEQGTSMAPLQGGVTEGIARALSGGLAGVVGRDQREKARIADTYWADKSNQANRPVVEASLNPASVAAAAPEQAAMAQQAPPIPPQGPPPVPPPQAAMPPQGAIPPGVDPAATVAGALTPAQGPQPAQSAQTPFPSPTSPASGVSPSPRILRPGDPAGVSRRRAANDYNSYQSSAYEPFENKYAAQYGVPVSLLRSIRLAGEKSNANQVSSVGAKSVYQFTPETRRLFMDKHGVDPWAGPEQAAQAAAIHLATDFKATGGDAAETVARYIAGPSGKNRGRVTRAYVGRVMNAYNNMGGAEAQPGEAAPVEQGPEPSMADLPQPMAEPERPKFGDRVRSTRLEVARNLLGNTDRADAAGIFALSQPYLDKGYDEDQASKVQREADLRRQDEQKYASDLGMYGHQKNTAFDLPYSEYQAETANRRGDVDRADTQRFTTSEREAAQRFTADQATLNRQSDEVNARIKAANSGRPPPVWVGKAIVQNNSTVDKLRAIKAMIEKRKESVGARFQWTPDFLASRMDPDGIDARAALAEITTTMIHDKTGSAQSIAEVERLKPYIPGKGDEPGAVGTKIDKLIDAIETEQYAIDEQFPGANQRGAGSNDDDALVNKYL